MDRGALQPVNLVEGRAVELDQVGDSAGEGDADRADPVEPLHGGGGHLGHVEPEHLERNARPEHDVSRLGVDVDVELSGRRRAAVGHGPAHERDALDPLSEGRVLDQGRRDVRQRPGGDEPEVVVLWLASMMKSTAWSGESGTVGSGRSTPSRPLCPWISGA